MLHEIIEQQLMSTWKIKMIETKTNVCFANSLKPLLWVMQN